MIPRCPQPRTQQGGQFFKGVPKRKQGAEMMPLTCAPLGHWALPIGNWEPRCRGGEPDGCRGRAGGSATARAALQRRPLACVSRWTGGGWDGGLAEATFLWTHPFDPGRLAIMLACGLAWPSCPFESNGLFDVVFQPAGQVPGFGTGHWIWVTGGRFCS